MRYESESRTWSIAAAEVSRRVRAQPEFAEARKLVLEAAFVECRGRSAAELRELGGFTAVIKRHVATLPDKYRAALGSKLLPATVVSELSGQAEIGAMRFELQRRCSEYLGRWG